MFWVELQNNKISGKGESPDLIEGQIEVTKQIYDQLTRLPADFETDTEGNIISVTPVPEPPSEPPEPTTEDYLLDLDYRLSKIELGL